MTDIITVPLKTLQDGVDSLKNKKVKLKEFAFFVNSSMIYDDYYIQIGPRGGVTVCYGKSLKLHVGHYAFAEASVKEGVRYKASGSYSTATIFPSRKDTPRVLAKAEKCLQVNVKHYKQAYDRAKSRLDKLVELGKEYPEYSL